MSTTVAQMTKRELVEIIETAVEGRGVGGEGEVSPSPWAPAQRGGGGGRGSRNTLTQWNTGEKFTVADNVSEFPVPLKTQVRYLL